MNPIMKKMLEPGPLGKEVEFSEINDIAEQIKEKMEFLEQLSLPLDQPQTNEE